MGPASSPMPLTAGTRLGHYNVTALLGEGGMGNVWRHVVSAPDIKGG